MTTPTTEPSPQPWNIKLSEFDRRGAVEACQLEWVQQRPEAFEASFCKGIDERTRRPIRYKLRITPATQTGTWTQDDESGLLESVHAHKDGNHIAGIWVENGQRRRFDIQPGQLQ